GFPRNLSSKIASRNLLCRQPSPHQTGWEAFSTAGVQSFTPSQQRGDFLGEWRLWSLAGMQSELKSIQPTSPLGGTDAESRQGFSLRTPSERNLLTYGWSFWQSCGSRSGS